MSSTRKKKSPKLVHPVIGDMTPAEASVKLRGLGYSKVADKISLDSSEKFAFVSWPGSDKPRPWQHSSNVFGFIAPVSSKSASLDIVHAGEIKADDSLTNSRVKIALDRFRVYDYPGSGMHQVLLDFYGQNQVQGQKEDLHFTQTYRIQQGEQAASSATQSSWGSTSGLMESIFGARR